LTAGALTVSDVRDAFAQEGIPLRDLPGKSEADVPSILIPVDHAQSQALVASIYGPDQATGDLGLGIANQGFETVRVRNVVVSFAPSGSAVQQVRAAIESLRVRGS